SALLSSLQSERIGRSYPPGETTTTATISPTTKNRTQASQRALLGFSPVQRRHPVNPPSTDSASYPPPKYARTSATSESSTLSVASSSTTRPPAMKAVRSAA